MNLRCRESVANTSIFKCPWLPAWEPSRWGGAPPSCRRGDRRQADGGCWLSSPHHFLMQSNTGPYRGCLQGARLILSERQTGLRIHGQPRDGQFSRETHRASGLALLSSWCVPRNAANLPQAGRGAARSSRVTRAVWRGGPQSSGSLGPRTAAGTWDPIRSTLRRTQVTPPQGSPKCSLKNLPYSKPHLSFSPPPFHTWGQECR